MKAKFTKTNSFIGAILFLALIMGLVMPTQTAKAATLCVAPLGAGGCYATIQAAITAAAPGDTINVAAGTYAGNIIVDRSVSIIGDPGDTSPGPGPSAPVIDGGSLPGDAFLLANGVSNVTIQGFEMRNFTSPLMDGIGNGISAWEASTSNITIQDNYFHHLGYNGVLVGNDGAAGDHTNWLIKGNVIENFGYIGFELTNTSNSSIEGNVIHMTTPYIGAIFSSARRSETGLTVKNNLIDGTPSTLFPVIYMYAYDLDMANPNLDNVLIEGNTISTSGTPFQIYMRNIGTGTVTNVHIHENSLSTLKNLTGATIDATKNWWGAASGPGAGAISGDVIYAPWYMDAGMTTLGPIHNVTKDTYYPTIQAAVDAASNNDTINVAAGTYIVSSQINFNKTNLTLSGAGSASTIVQVSGTGYRFYITASGVTIDGFGIQKTDKVGLQNIIYIGANNISITNNEISGQFVIGEGDTSRAMEFAGGLSGLNISGNTIHNLRQPGYINGVTTGTISNNYVYLTKGWVIQQGDMTFTNNTWGTGANSNVYDIAILSLVSPIYYTDLPALSAANNGAFIEDQRTSPATLSIVYVDGSVVASGDGTASSPKKTIAEGITRVTAGGTVHVAVGTYTEQLTITKDLHLIGAGIGLSIIAAPATLPISDLATSAIVLISGSGVDAELTGFTVTGPGPSGCGSIRAGIYVYDGANANIHDNRIQDIRDNPFSGCQNGVAIVVGRQAWSTTGTATITNNVIVGYQKGGIVVDNTGSSATITNNTVTGAGTTSVTAQNGIQISRGATANLSFNNVTGNSFHLVGSTWDWGAAGILLYQSGAVSMMGWNNVGGNDNNLYIQGPTGAITFGFFDAFGPSSAPAGSGYDVVNYSTQSLSLPFYVIFAGAANNFEIEDRIWHGVDESGLGLVTWVAGNLYVTPSSGTIQRAIDIATPGNTINIAAGTYIENVIVNKSVTLAGVGAGTIVQPAVSNPVCTPGSLCGGAASNVFLVQANNVIIHDLTVDGDNPALTGGFDKGGANIDARNGIIKNTDATYNNLEVYNVTVKNIYLRGIYSTGGSFNFHHNTVTNVQAEGASIAMFAWGGPGIMANNTVSNANDAISANHSNGIQFLNNIVTLSGSGIHTDNSGDAGGVADLIQGNNVDCTGKPGAYGIWVFVPYIAPTVNNNIVTNCSVGLSAWGQGAAVTTQFTNNTVTGDLSHESVGAYITTDLISWGYSDVSVNFSGNVFTNFETGVYLTADQQTWNTYPFTAQTINATFHLNQISGNTKGADKGTTGTYVANFENNWWGAASGPGPVGPGTGDTVAAGFTYTPWCVNEACSGNPPPMPSSFYGYIHIYDGAPSAGDKIDAYLPGVSGIAASGTIVTDPGGLGYLIKVPGDVVGTSTKEGGVEGDIITFKIGTRIVATAVWHESSSVWLDIHPPQALPGGPYNGLVNASISFSGSANDWGTDASTYAWDLDNNGSYETPNQNVSNSWATVGTKTVGLQVTDLQGGVGTATVEVNIASITLSNLTQTYDGTPKVPTVVTDPTGLTVNLTYDGLPTAPSAVGDYTVVATITGYAGSVTDTLHITPADLSITAKNQSKIYGATFTFLGTEFDVVGLATGDSVDSVTLTSAGAAPTATVAGSTYPIVPSDAIGTGLSNYNIAYHDGSMTVTRKAASVTANNRSKTYGDLVTFAGTEFTPSGFVNSDGVTSVTLTSDGAAVTATVALSPYTITPSAATGTGLDNYDITYNTGSLTVGTKAASVTANNRSKTYGDLVTFAGTEFTPSGFVNGDTVTSVTLASAGAPVTAWVSFFPYAITLSDAIGSGLSNYNIIYIPGALTVNPKALDITAKNQTKVFGTTFTFLGTEYDVVGLVNGDMLMNVNLTSDGAVSTAAPGNYDIVPSAAMGMGIENYTITYHNGNFLVLGKHSISLVSGWNLISFNLVPVNTNIATVLSSIAGNYDLVYAWDATVGSSNWKKYSPTAPLYSNTLSALNEKMGFWIHMTSADTLDVTGNAPAVPTEISLRTEGGGWNLVGYPSAATISLPAALQDHGVGTDFSLVYSYRAAETPDPWKLFDRVAPAFANDLTSLSPGWGYWVKVSVSHVWHVEY
jgi:hypothetical protein